MDYEQNEILRLLWDNLPKVKERGDCRMTKFGAKTKEGLTRTVMGVVLGELQELVDGGEK